MRSVVGPLSLLAVSFALFAPAGEAEPVKRPEFPRVLIGHVTDAEEMPVENVRVEWGRFNAEPKDREFVLTDDRGNYRIETSKVGRDFRIGFSKPGYAPQWEDGIIPGPASKPTERSIKLTAGTTINIRLKDANGAPLSGVDVTPSTASNGLYSSFSSPTPSTSFPGASRTVTTNSQGEATLKDLPARPGEDGNKPDADENWLHLNINVAGDGSYTRDVKETMVGTAPIEISLPVRYAKGILRARVVDQLTGKPITSFRVTRRYSPEVNTFQSTDGTFTIEGVPLRSSEHEIRIFAPNYAVAVAELAAKATTSNEADTIKLEPHPSFEGRLVSPESRRPLPNVNIIAGNSSKEGWRYVEWSDIDRYADGMHGFSNVIRLTTDADGRFSIPESKSEAAAMIILAPGLERRIILPEKRPKPGADGVSEIIVQPGTSLTAIPLRETPLGAIADSVAIFRLPEDGVEHMDHATALDGNGRLKFESLAPGEYRLILYKSLSNMTFPLYSQKVVVKAGENRDIELGKMPGELRLSGVTNPFGLVRISSKANPEEGYFAVPADIDGNFELRGLAAGEYSVTVDVSSASTGYLSDIPPRTIQLLADTKLDLTVAQLIKDARAATKEE